MNHDPSPLSLVRSRISGGGVTMGSLGRGLGGGGYPTPNLGLLGSSVSSSSSSSSVLSPPASSLQEMLLCENEYLSAQGHR